MGSEADTLSAMDCSPYRHPGAGAGPACEGKVTKDTYGQDEME
jgi:hypothetical protein